MIEKLNNLIELVLNPEIKNYRPKGVDNVTVKLGKKHRNIKDFWKRNDLYKAGIPFFSKIPGVVGEYLIVEENGYCIIYWSDGKRFAGVYTDYFTAMEYFVRKTKEDKNFKVIDVQPIMKKTFYR